MKGHDTAMSNENPTGAKSPGEGVYQHDCDNCRFLGRYEGCDLYYCHMQTVGPPTVLARWGGNGPEYISGLALANSFTLKQFPNSSLQGSGSRHDRPTAEMRALRVALLIAQDMGLLG